MMGGTRGVGGLGVRTERMWGFVRCCIDNVAKCNSGFRNPSKLQDVQSLQVISITKSIFDIFSKNKFLTDEVASHQTHELLLVVLQKFLLYCRVKFLLLRWCLQQWNGGTSSDY